MIMKKILAILGAGVVAGAAVFVLWNKLYKNNIDSTESVFDDETSDANSTEAVPTTIAPVYTSMDAAKNIAVHNVSARHEEAAKIMKDAVDIICKRSEVLEDESNDLEQISNGLDDLLNEV